MTLPLVAILLLAFFGQYEGDRERLEEKFVTNYSVLSSRLLSSTDRAELRTRSRMPLRIWKWSIADNVRSVLSVWASRFKNGVDTIVTLSVLFVVIGFYAHIVLKTFGLSLLTLSPFSIAPMFLLGGDTYRWGALAVTNMFIISLVMIQRGRAVPCADFSSKRLVSVGKLLFLMGPFGIHTFPVRYYVESVLEALLRQVTG